MSSVMRKDSGDSTDMETLNVIVIHPKAGQILLVCQFKKNQPHHRGFHTDDAA